MDALEIDPIVDQEHAGWLTSRKDFILIVLNYIIDAFILNKYGLRCQVLDFKAFSVFTKLESTYQHIIFRSLSR
jgi:hypothetical protein